MDHAPWSIERLQRPFRRRVVRQDADAELLVELTVVSVITARVTVDDGARRLAHEAEGGALGAIAGTAVGMCSICALAQFSVPDVLSARLLCNLRMARDVRTKRPR